MKLEWDAILPTQTPLSILSKAKYIYFYLREKTENWLFICLILNCFFSKYIQNVYIVSKKCIQTYILRLFVPVSE